MSARIPFGSHKARERFLARRRLRLRRIVLVASALFIITGSLALYSLWHPALRVSHIEVFGLTEDERIQAENIVRNVISGEYIGIIPRDSIVFIPESDIRGKMLQLNYNIAAISISRSGLTGIVIDASIRTPIARWCGTATADILENQCYIFDASGEIYAPASAVVPINTFALYAPLKNDVANPMGATIASAHKLPAVFNFARELAALGPRVETVSIIGDEVSNVLTNGVRIVYVLGQESRAYSALVSAIPKVPLNDTALKYVDLRFDGKVYIKKNER